MPLHCRFFVPVQQQKGHASFEAQPGQHQKVAQSAGSAVVWWLKVKLAVGLEMRRIGLERPWAQTFGMGTPGNAVGIQVRSKSTASGG